MPFAFQPAFTFTPASYSHSTSTFNKLYHRITGFLQSTMRPHLSTARPLERAANHIKGTCPSCLFRLPPWENVNRSTTLMHQMWVTLSY